MSDVVFTEGWVCLSSDTGASWVLVIEATDGRYIVQEMLLDDELRTAGRDLRAAAREYLGLVLAQAPLRAERGVWWRG